MFRNVQKLKKFGVFHDYSKGPDLLDFADKNVIYGWNYSGKTTLSRLFGCFAAKAVNPDFVGSSFSLVDSLGRTHTELNISSCDHVIAVFNSDFVASNLSWTGSDFQPILLLGKDSVEAEKRILELQGLLDRCRQNYSRRRDELAKHDASEAEAKTTSARRIKTTLQLVDAFTATHLANEIESVKPDLHSAVLSESAFGDLLKLALTAEKDKAKPVQLISIPLPDFESLAGRVAGACLARPKFAKTIEKLRTNPGLANWIEDGLNLHDARGTCEFCGNTIPEGRLKELFAHFSTDLAEHKAVLRDATMALERAVVRVAMPNPKDVDSRYAEELAISTSRLVDLVRSYNLDIEALLQAVKIKINQPFDLLPPPNLFPSPAPLIAEALRSVNAVLSKHNSLSDSFREEKARAVKALKRHLAAEFWKTDGMARRSMVRASKARHLERFKTLGEGIKGKIQELYATIDRSQRGRERLNLQIGRLLGAETIQIRAIKVNGVDRFQLARGDVPARNLSDGERTAIAFAFFLTKLEEHPDLGQVIVYIDDPISSLDSNHVFQVYSIIASKFFKKKADENGNEEWFTACKQLFISTHNFEFLELLKKLPCSKSKTRYFMVRRTSPATSVLENLHPSILKYKSEYHYLFSVIYRFHNGTDKGNIENLLSLPNAMRRFIELYTYMRLPSPSSTVDQRAEALFGKEKSARIIKLLHHFSHLEAIERLATNTNLIADIDSVVGEVISLVREDEVHFAALEAAASAT